MSSSAQAASGRSAANSSPSERAEAIVEEAAERMGRGLSRWVTRAREEAEDIWAEAQDVRQRWETAPRAGRGTSSGTS